MKTSGIVRCMDELGRIVIPKEIRKILDINLGDAIEITLDDDKIILSKRISSCIFCQSKEDLALFENKAICKTCINRIKQNT